MSKFKEDAEKLESAFTSYYDRYLYPLPGLDLNEMPGIYAHWQPVNYSINQMRERATRSNWFLNNARIIYPFYKDEDLDRIHHIAIAIIQKHGYPELQNDLSAIKTTVFLLDHEEIESDGEGLQIIRFKKKTTPNPEESKQTPVTHIEHQYNIHDKTVKVEKNYGAISVSDKVIESPTTQTTNSTTATKKSSAGWLEIAYWIAGIGVFLVMAYELWKTFMSGAPHK